ncbi:MAG: sterol desaturase family protein [bacterium]|nr:sterol desaturase family protein [bacterium]
MGEELEKIYTWKIDSLSLFLRYFVFAGISYFIFYVWKSKTFQKIKIQEAVPSKNHIVREILFSISTLLIHCAAGWMAFYMWKAGHTKIYLNISDQSGFYFIFSVLAMILIHDTYFYWTHRFIHLPGIYNLIHKVHHRSTNPTPWASFSFHPLEALISVGVLPIYLFCMPVHPIALFLFLTGMTLINVLGHLGYEIFSSGFRKSEYGKWHNTSSNHNLHHQNQQYNFGLYFSFWDRIMNTYLAPQELKK